MGTPSFKVVMSVKNGKVMNHNPVGYTQFLKLLEEGEELLVEFKRKKFEKTYGQLKLAYLYLGIIKEETGNSVEAIDMWTKRQMGVCFSEKVGGEDVLHCTSKADFTKEQMEEYVNWLTQLAVSLGIKLPDPLAV